MLKTPINEISGPTSLELFVFNASNNFGFIDLALVIVFLCLYGTYIFLSCRKMVKSSLNAIFPEKICNFSYNNL